MATNTTQYTVKKGDTLSGIASSLGVPANTTSYASWGYSGDPTKLPVGLTLNIAAPAAPPGSSNSGILAADDPANKYNTSTGAPNPNYKGPTGTNGAIPTGGASGSTGGTSGSGSETDWSASFASLNDKQQALANQESGDFPLPPPTGSAAELSSPEYQSKEAGNAHVKASAADSKQAIIDQSNVGQLNEKRALEQISASPAASRAVIDDYVAQTETFSHSISTALDSLQAEEDNAIATNNLNYANQIRQEKLDYYNMEQTNLQNQQTFTQNAYNMVLTGKQYDQTEKANNETEATNYMNTTIPSYAGSGYTLDTLPAGTAAQIRQQAAVLGLSDDVVNQMLVGSSDLDIIHDETTGWVVGIDKKTGKTMFQNLVPGRTGTTTEPKATIAETTAGLTQAISNNFNTNDPLFKTSGGSQYSVEEYAKALNTWSVNSPTNLATFFVNFPVSGVVDTDATTTPATKGGFLGLGGTKAKTSNSEIYNHIQDVYNASMKVSPEAAAFAALLYHGTTPVTTLPPQGQ